MTVMQLKQRGRPTDNPDVERRWFENKVLGKATKQVRDTIRYLNETDSISITNEHEHSFEINASEIETIIKVVVFLADKNLPDECWKKRFHVSDSVGFTHVLAAHDYLGVVQTLKVPEDIKRYFAYREQVLLHLHELDRITTEPEIMCAFVSEVELPETGNIEALTKLQQDTENFDLSQLMGNLHKHINRAENPYDYYKILREFAVLPRSFWREFKTRFHLSLDATRDTEFKIPYLLGYPDSDCAFMIAPLDPDFDVSGPSGETMRVAALINYSLAAKYVLKTSKVIGVQLSKDGDYFQIDWVFNESEWRQDDELENLIAENNPFRDARERVVHSFQIKTS
jgi:hypothetical protein